jgi:NADPH2:quinone reductase
MNVLIHAAAGGVGTTAIQIARIAGAGRVLGTAGGPDKVAYARSLGADDVFDYRAGDFGPAVLAATDGRGVDVVLDAVGGDARRQSLAVLAHEGRHVLFGNASAQPEMEAPTRLLRDKQLTISGFHLTAVRSRHPDLVRAAVNDLLAWLVDGRLRFCVTEVLPLGRAADAHRLLETRQSRGKLLLAPAER